MTFGVWLCWCARPFPFPLCVMRQAKNAVQEHYWIKFEWHSFYVRDYWGTRGEHVIDAVVFTDEWNVISPRLSSFFFRRYSCKCFIGIRNCWAHKTSQPTASCITFTAFPSLGDKWQGMKAENSNQQRPNCFHFPIIRLQSFFQRFTQDDWNLYDRRKLFIYCYLLWTEKIV